jgi:hypothetical protein
MRIESRILLINVMRICDHCLQDPPRLQGFGSESISGSALISVAGSGSGSRKAKMTHKNKKKYRIFIF